MKFGDMTNQLVTRDFFEAVLDVISENTSVSYGILAINGLKEQLTKEFKFLRNVSINNGTIQVSYSIDYVNKNELKRFFIKTINMVGPNYLKVLLSRRLNKKDLVYLEEIGIRFG